MLDKIIAFAHSYQVNKFLANTQLQLTADDCLIDIIWLNYSIEKNDNTEVVPVKRRDHKHSFYELHLCLKGCCRYLVDETQFSIKPGEAILIQKDKTHYCVDESMNLCKISFGFDLSKSDSRLMKELDALLSRRPATITGDTEKILQLFYRILEECSKQEIGFMPIVKGYLREIIIACARINASAEATIPEFDKRVDQRISDVNHYIQIHLQDSISCQSIADNVHLSLRQLNRIIASEFGMSVQAYVDKQKCNYAKSLLMHTSLSISDIVMLVGYANEFSFGKFFKRLEGLTPFKFRTSRFGSYSNKLSTGKETY